VRSLSSRVLTGSLRESPRRDGEVMFELRNKRCRERPLVGPFCLHFTRRQLQPPSSTLLHKVYAKDD
jgi:hypothetical protein